MMNTDNLCDQLTVLKYNIISCHIQKVVTLRSIMCLSSDSVTGLSLSLFQIHSGFARFLLQ